MSSLPPRVAATSETGPEKLRLIAEAIDSRDLPQSHPGLTLVPESPGRVHASWSIDPALLERGQSMLGVAPRATRLVLRVYHFDDFGDAFENALAWRDFPIQGRENRGYFDLEGQPAFVNGVIGLLNEHNHFRPIIRGQAVALPQAPGREAARPAPERPAANALLPGASAEPLDEASILARLQSLEGLPAEMLRSPEALIRLAESERADSGLDAGAIHAAVLVEAGRQASPEAGEHPEARPSSAARGGASELAGASDQLASQLSDAWDDRAALNLRAELVVSGRLAPGVAITCGGEHVRPLPGGQFQMVRKLNGFREVWPLIAGLGSLAESPSGAVTLAQTERGGRPLLEMHTAVTIEGRVNDEAYRRYLPDWVQCDGAGRFKATFPLPNGAVLLPDLSLIAQA